MNTNLKLLLVLYRLKNTMDNELESNTKVEE